MLRQLTIKNYALIRHLEMVPSSQLTVITGETGAGKSIMLGAVGLLLGNRADTKVLWDEAEKCVTEGIFDIKPYKLKRLFEEPRTSSSMPDSVPPPITAAQFCARRPESG